MKFGISVGLLVLHLAGPAFGQGVDAPRSGAGIYVLKAYAEPDDTGEKQRRCCTTGKLHIQYSDGSEIVQDLHGPGVQRGFERQAGFADIQIAQDKQTVGWSETYYAGASYPYPLGLVVLRNKKIIFRDFNGAMIWRWQFLDGGKRASAAWGVAHGSDCPSEFKLYDLERRKITIKEADRFDEPCLHKNSPRWASQLSN